MNIVIVDFIKRAIRKAFSADIKMRMKENEVPSVPLTKKTAANEMSSSLISFD